VSFGSQLLHWNGSNWSPFSGGYPCISPNTVTNLAVAGSQYLVASCSGGPIPIVWWDGTSWMGASATGRLTQGGPAASPSAIVYGGGTAASNALTAAGWITLAVPTGPAGWSPMSIEFSTPTSSLAWGAEDAPPGNGGLRLSPSAGVVDGPVSNWLVRESFTIPTAPGFGLGTAAWNDSRFGFAIGNDEIVRCDFGP
jgi:hypothetical protein